MKQHQAPIPVHGLLRLPQVLSMIPISKSAWWEGCRTGRYPKPVKLGPRTTVWRAEDIADRELEGSDFKIAMDYEMNDEEYPEYGFAKHKGYGTREHIAAITAPIANSRLSMCLCSWSLVQILSRRFSVYLKRQKTNGASNRTGSATR